jgi:hypothetical protein
MYLVNKYTTWYNSIIDRAKTRSSLPGYKEKHHIIPKSLGGSNLKTNIVALTAREHVVCHILLTKMVSGKDVHKMAQAAWMMVVVSKGHVRYKISNRKYEQLRLAMSDSKKNKSTWNKGIPPSDDTRLKLRTATRAHLVSVGKMTQEEADYRNSFPLGIKIPKPVKPRKIRGPDKNPRKRSSGWKWSDADKELLARSRANKVNPV